MMIAFLPGLADGGGDTCIATTANRGLPVPAQKKRDVAQATQKGCRSASIHFRHVNKKCLGALSRRAS
jgi:hypothetical protein